MEDQGAEEVLWVMPRENGEGDSWGDELDERGEVGLCVLNNPLSDRRDGIV
jgi:hypothetical protein